MAVPSDYFFYLVPAFCAKVSSLPSQIKIKVTALNPRSPLGQIQNDAHVVFSKSPSPGTSSIASGTTYYVTNVWSDSVDNCSEFQLREYFYGPAKSGLGKMCRVWPETQKCALKKDCWFQDSHHTTVVTIASSAKPEDCDKDIELFKQDINSFIECATKLLPNSSASFVTFQQRFGARRVGCNRALLRLSLPCTDTCPDLKSLKAIGYVLVYPPYQFAAQALMGNNLNLLDKSCGLAFLDTMARELQQPVDTFEEFAKFAFSNIRNLFAHSSESGFHNRSGFEALLSATKAWCFAGTELEGLHTSRFWENSDVLGYIFTATPLAYFLPLCYQAVCAKMNQHSPQCRAEVVSIHGENISVQSFEADEDDYLVTFSADAGKLKQGFTYHVKIDTPAPRSPSVRKQIIANFNVSLCSNGDPICVFDPPPSEPASVGFGAPVLPTATFQKRRGLLEKSAILGCMPSAQPSSEVPSLLDSYFSYDISLLELMSHLEDGYNDEQLFASVVKPKKNQHRDSSICKRFAELRRKFNHKLSSLFEIHKRRWAGAGYSQDPYKQVSLWCEDDAFSIDSSQQSVTTASALEQHAAPATATTERQKKSDCKVWLGLSKCQPFGRQTRPVRIPKAVKTQEPTRLKDFSTLIDYLKTGSNIASAKKHDCLKFPPNAEAFRPDLQLQFGPDDTVSTPNPDPNSNLSPEWLFEAGICTLKELFGNGVSDEERATLAFRDLMRQIFQSMALAVSQLHECGIVHMGISEGFFKIFPISESLVQRLRVKLVGLKKAQAASSFDEDVKNLGETMCWIATVNSDQDARDFESRLLCLKAYDPSLYFLLKWMTTEAPAHPPTMHEVLRHPYFMSPAERQTFAIALGGGMIGAYLCDDPHQSEEDKRNEALCAAVQVELTNHLEHQLGLMFKETFQQQQQSAEAAAASSPSPSYASMVQLRPSNPAAAAPGAAPQSEAPAPFQPVVPKKNKRGQIILDGLF